MKHEIENLEGFDEDAYPMTPYDARPFIVETLKMMEAIRKTNQVPHLFELEAMTQSAEALLNYIDWDCPTLNSENSWKPIETAPVNQRVLVASGDEMAMGWLDAIDLQWYYAPQGGLVTRWIPTKWTPLPE